MGTLMHCVYTMSTDTTLDDDDTQTTVHTLIATTRQAHSRSRSVFGYFAERAILTGCEPNELFEGLVSHTRVDTG